MAVKLHRAGARHARQLLEAGLTHSSCSAS